jgi:hypothetical protein
MASVIQKTSVVCVRRPQTECGSRAVALCASGLNRWNFKPGNCHEKHDKTQKKMEESCAPQATQVTNDCAKGWVTGVFKRSLEHFSPTIHYSYRIPHKHLQAPACLLRQQLFGSHTPKMQQDHDDVTRLKLASDSNLCGHCSHIGICIHNRQGTAKPFGFRHTTASRARWDSMERVCAQLCGLYILPLSQKH